jgi:cytochrome c peroxidase
MKKRIPRCLLPFLVVSLAPDLSLNAQSLPNLFPFPNSTGILETYNQSGGPIRLSGPFFQAFGTNGRSCASCHRPAQGWSISADEVKLRFEITAGRDPIFRTVDGSNCRDVVATDNVRDRRKAYSLLLSRGLIRVEVNVPSNAEFEALSVDNPYGCNDTTALSMYRRPIPSTNLRFQSAVMWDGRESAPQTGTQKITYATNPGDLLADLAHQAVDATNGHAQGTSGLTTEQQKAIVDFEMSLTTAQAYDYEAGPLNHGGANGGPEFIAQQTLPDFFIGINDPLGGNPKNIPFTPVIFSLFDNWIDATSRHGFFKRQYARRESIARGEKLFNSKPINIVNVGGLNDDLDLPTIPGTCGTCHDSPNVGNHSLPVPLNIGVGDIDSPLDVSYLPVFTLRNKTTFAVKKTTDPGRALITGAWRDIGRVKGPILHGLSSRAPYFHNGSAQTLAEVVDFYDQRFVIGFTSQEKQDLIAFLSAL